MSQNSIVSAEECAFRTPNVCHVTFHLHAFVLWNILTATSHNDFKLQIANVLDRKVFLADYLTDERVRSAWENEVVLLAKERLQLVKWFWNWFVVTRCQCGVLNKNSVKPSLSNENFLGGTFDTELSYNRTRFSKQVWWKLSLPHLF